MKIGMTSVALALSLWMGEKVEAEVETQELRKQPARWEVMVTR